MTIVVSHQSGEVLASYTPERGPTFSKLMPGHEARRRAAYLADRCDAARIRGLTLVEVRGLPGPDTLDLADAYDYCANLFAVACSLDGGAEFPVTRHFAADGALTVRPL